MGAVADRTAAERQRRYRKHRAGDHTLCDPGRGCGDGVDAVTVTRDAVPVGLGDAGRRLWSAMYDAERPGEQVALVVEACRIVDRLDRLDRLVRGDEYAWAYVRVNDDGEAALVIDKALSEARQQAIALKLIVAELRQAGAASGAPASGPAKPASGGGGDVLDQLARKRAERIADTASS
jgi:hypothetical protein